MNIFLVFLGGIAFEIVLGFLYKKYKVKTIVENDIAYLEAKAAALKKAL